METKNIIDLLSKNTDVFYTVLTKCGFSSTFFIFSMVSRYYSGLYNQAKTQINLVYNPNNDT